MLSPTIKAVTLLVCCSLAFGAVAQTADTVRVSVEKSTWVMSTTISVYNELRLTDQIALRTEAGLDVPATLYANILLALSSLVEGTSRVFSESYRSFLITLGGGTPPDSVDFSAFFPSYSTVWAPFVAVGPRWYYNLDKRMRQSKSTAGNSGNFVSLPVTYEPFVTGDGVVALHTISVLPTWGIRRNVRHFNLELGVGVGVLVVFGKIIPSRLYIVPIPNFHVRIGYRFYKNISKKKKNRH